VQGEAEEKSVVEDNTNKNRAKKKEN